MTRHYGYGGRPRQTVHPNYGYIANDDQWTPDEWYGYYQEEQRPYPNRRRRNWRNSRYQSQPRHTIPAEFFHVTKLHFKIVKCFHHVSRLNESLPAQLLRSCESLTNSLKPAFVSNTFKALRGSLAMKWAKEASRALLSHYQQTLTLSENELSTSAMPEHLMGKSMAIVQKWTRRHLGKRLRQETLDAAFARILELQPHSTTIDPVPEQPPRSRRPRQRRFQHDAVTQTNDEVLRNTPHHDRSNNSDTMEAAHSETAHQLTNTSVNDETTTATTNDCDTTDMEVSQTPSDRRKRHFSTSPRETQLDLFGTPLPFERSPPRRRSRSVPSLTTFEPSREAVLFGDSNYSSFCDPAVDVYANANGRLSHYRTILASTSETFDNVKTCVLGLSSLDKTNSFTSNSSTLRRVLALARKVFPRASFSIVLCAISKSFTETETNTINETNIYVRTKQPSGCAVIEVPEGFDFASDRWTDPMRELVFFNIKKHLNSKA